MCWIYCWLKHKKANEAIDLGGGRNESEFFSLPNIEFKWKQSSALMENSFRISGEIEENMLLCSHNKFSLVNLRVVVGEGERKLENNLINPWMCMVGESLLWLHINVVVSRVNCGTNQIFTWRRKKKLLTFTFTFSRWGIKRKKQM